MIRSDGDPTEENVANVIAKLICASRRLPGTIVLDYGSVTDARDHESLVVGGYGEIWLGSYAGGLVAVKRLIPRDAGEPTDKTKKVGRHLSLT